MMAIATHIKLSGREYQKRKICFIFLFFLFLSGCNKSPWIYRELPRCTTTTQPAILAFVSPSIFNGFQLKFLKGDFGLKAYLGTYNKLPPTDSKICVVKYSIEGEEFQDSAIIMEGEQCVLLSEIAAENLMLALSMGKDCQITFAGLSRNIPASDFQGQYKRFAER